MAPVSFVFCVLKLKIYHSQFVELITNTLMLSMVFSCLTLDVSLFGTLISEKRGETGMG